MITVKSEQEARALGAERIIRDSEDSYRCYMPGEIKAPDPVPEVPSVSMRAFRKALSQVGLRQAVEDYVAAAPIDVRDDWATAPSVRRDNALILAAADALKQDAAALDGLFALAGQIEAEL